MGYAETGRFTHQGHDDRLSDKIYWRVGNLGKVLLEVFNHERVMLWQAGLLTKDMTIASLIGSTGGLVTWAVWSIQTWVGYAVTGTVTYQGHDDRLSNRIYRRVGNLGKVLLEVVKREWVTLWQTGLLAKDMTIASLIGSIGGLVTWAAWRIQT